jgi:ABC-type cobalamin/Fe3+-siderophores transport system ATPase subunit
MTTFTFIVPTTGGAVNVSLESGQTIVMVGANGSGKTRLATAIETSLGLKGHRVAAHRALGLNTEVPKISESTALAGLRTGWADARAGLNHREGHRWSSKKETSLLNDYDFLLQALFAEQANTALRTHTEVRDGTLRGEAPATNLEQLKRIWESLLPNRTLVLSADTIQVKLADGTQYSAGDMSDGERTIFYMLGQALVATNDSLLIVDEPELHVHPSIMDKLWDAIQAARPDCGFVFITHDLSFAAARPGQKFAVREYQHTPTPQWAIEPVPADTGFDEELVTLILGSRKPVLFVEGTGTSLDIALYRACFPEWTVIPRGSCEEVIHSVVTMRRNQSMTRVTCAGLVDADDYSHDERAFLNDAGIAVLSVSEIENMILLPGVGRAIASSEAYRDGELAAKLSALKKDVYAAASSSAVDAVVARYCRRRIDRTLKRIDLSDASTADAIAIEFTNRTTALNVAATATAARDRIATAVAGDDLYRLLQVFDNKGVLLALAARHLKATRRDRFEEWLVRALNNNTVTGLIEALRAALPEIRAR